MAQGVTRRTRTKRGVGRPRIYVDEAAKQRAYRERKRNQFKKSRTGKGR